MSTMSVQDRRDVVRRPIYRRPEWTQVSGAGGSNTWGYGVARRPSAVQVSRVRERNTARERPFDLPSRRERFRRRAASVIVSPGVTLVALSSLVVMLAVSPVLTGTEEGVTTPVTTATVTVGEGESLADIAREHVPGVSVGDAVARISSLNDTSDLGEVPVDGGDRTAGQGTRQVVVPVY